jgi:hypothetical protein
VDEDPEDYQALRGAPEGWIRLYYVDELQKLAEWTIPSLQCIEHDANDGLMTSVEGMQHSVLVKMPVGLMDKAGDYRFVISAKDSHEDREKGHRQKWALERNQTLKRRKIEIAWQAMMAGQGLSENLGIGLPFTGVGQKIYPDLPLPPSQIPQSERSKYQRVKVMVTVNDAPNTSLTVYLRLFDPDDPSSKTSPIDANDNDPAFDTCRPSDNRGVAKFVGGSTIVGNQWGRLSDINIPVTTNQKGTATATAIIELPGNPGDNFKVAAALDSGTRDAMYVGQGSQTDALRIWVDVSGADWKVPEGQEQDTNPPARASRLLTVFRRLHVEVDSMGAPPASETFYPYPDSRDDPNPGDVKDPSLDALIPAMKEAYVDVLQDTGHDEHQTTWHYDFPSTPDLYAYGKANRQSEEAADYWSAHVIGVYELGEHPDPDAPTIFTDLDNDPDNEHTNPGDTDHIRPKTSLIAMEQIRDFTVQFTLSGSAIRRHMSYAKTLAVITAHEIGHQVIGPHHSEDHDNLMWVPSSDLTEQIVDTTPFKWKASHIDIIRDGSFLP